MHIISEKAPPTLFAGKKQWEVSSRKERLPNYEAPEKSSE